MRELTLVNHKVVHAFRMNIINRSNNDVFILIMQKARLFHITTRTAFKNRNIVLNNLILLFFQHNTCFKFIYLEIIFHI